MRSLGAGGKLVNQAIRQLLQEITPLIAYTIYVQSEEKNCYVGLTDITPDGTVGGGGGGRVHYKAQNRFSRISRLTHITPHGAVLGGRGGRFKAAECMSQESQVHRKKTGRSLREQDKGGEITMFFVDAGDGGDKVNRRSTLGCGDRYGRKICTTGPARRRRRTILTLSGNEAKYVS